MANAKLSGALILATMIAVGATTASAEAAKKKTTATQGLPPYCQARLGDNAASKKSWSQQLGSENFLHLHHYCYGLNFMNQARFEPDKRKRKYLLEQARTNFDYVIRLWPAGFSLTAQAKAYRMQAQTMLGSP